MTHSPPAVDARPRKARGRPDDPLPAAGLPPQHTTGVQMATKASTTPSTSQGHDEMTRGSEDARGRSSS